MLKIINNMINRFFNIIVSFVSLVALIPVFLVISVLIKQTMPGPIFFIQERVGKKGTIFKLIKFRSMRVESNKLKGSFDAGDTSQITSFGKIIRNTKLDEIPQLINVLKGEMSIVGPRPEVLQWTKVYPEKWEIVHSVKPGITDNASIEFRNEEQILNNSDNPNLIYRDEILPRKLDLYIKYVNNKSLLGDIRIIFRTILVVIFK